MYERSYGSKYSALGGKFVPAADIAKMMRADIKELIGKGELPGVAANYSVRVHNYSGGRSIHIEARDLDGMWVQCPGYKNHPRIGMVSCGDSWCKAGGEHKDSEHAKFHNILSEEGARIEALLQEVHGAYNHDGSDSMVDYFDVNYYGNASIESEWDRKFRLSEKDRLAKRKAAKLAKAV